MLFLLVILLNVAISWWNARIVGLSWNYTAGWQRFLAWCGVVQSAVGFTMAYAVVLAGIAIATHNAPQHFVKYLSDIVYLGLVIPAIGTGIAITIESIRIAFRQGGFANSAVATYNTLAEASNIWSAFHDAPKALKELSGGENSDEDNAAVKYALVVAACSLLAGVLTTALLVGHYQKQVVAHYKGAY